LTAAERGSPYPAPAVATGYKYPWQVDERNCRNCDFAAGSTGTAVACYASRATTGGAIAAGPAVTA
jgi:hypothetical protein